MLALLALLTTAQAQTLTLEGECPGPVEITLSDLTPGGSVFVVAGDGPGARPIPSGPCAGISTGLSAPLTPFGPIRDSDGDGVISLTPSIPAPFCDLPFVAIDLASCGVSSLAAVTEPAGGFTNPPELEPDAAGVYNLSMQPGEVEIDGQRYCVRTWNGAVPGPTLRIPAGDDRSVRVDLHNDMAGPALREVGDAEYDFNQTNLHTHGLHVSPERTTDDEYYADNVLIHVMAGGESNHRYDIDEDFQHYSGTFWMHPHVHGATAIQVGSGMAGALIIEGAYDSVPGLADATERVMLLQHLPYRDATPLADEEECTGDNLSIDSFDVLTESSPTLLSGQLQPTLTVPGGDVEHWRFVHAGVTDVMRMSVHAATSADCGTWAGGAGVSLRQIAADGITLPTPFERDDLFMAPGYRVDLAFEAPDGTGTWCLVAERGAGPGLSTELLAVVEVDAALVATNPSPPSDEDLAASAPPTLACEGAVDGEQSVTLDQVGLGCPPLNIDCRSWEESLDDPRILPVDTVEEWTVQTGLGTHPYHIHVNPFTVCTERVDEPPAPHWRDTLLATRDAATLRASYDLYSGDFVQHCHKLDHEDQGMMELVRIE
ncbi:MAG: L-ascorbate oxidase [Myxococcota bacterium]|jgi:L-ascorbate oxidase